MYRLLTFLMLVPCESFSQGTFFIDDTEARKPMVSVHFDEAETPKITGLIESGDIKHAFGIHLVKENRWSPIPVSCNYTLEGHKVSLQPISTFGEGLEFVILSTLSGDTISQEYFTPISAQTQIEPSKILNVYPLADSIPQNILFYHLRFSQPMQSSKLAFESVGIYDEDGNKFEHLWRERSYWLDDNKLLVIMVHPGRVKRGIDHEIPYEAGKTYEFRAEGSFTDIYGNVIKQEFKKTYHYLEPDYQSPKILFEEILIPQAETKEELSIVFSDKMDHASIIDAVKIYDESMQEIQGEFISQDDKTFFFKPNSIWEKSTYKVVFGKVVSDLAANRLNRLFEMDNPSEVHKDEEVSWEFEIK